MAATVRSFSPHYRSRPKCRRPLRPAGQPGGHSRPGFGFSARRLPPLSCRSMAFALTSPAFADGSAVPAKYTCDGADVSPPLVWSGAPAGTVSFALPVDDPAARQKDVEAAMQGHTLGMAQLVGTYARRKR